MFAEELVNDLAEDPAGYLAEDPAQDLAGYLAGYLAHKEGLIERIQGATRSVH